jgi:hypothetical protein
MVGLAVLSTFLIGSHWTFDNLGVFFVSLLVGFLSEIVFFFEGFVGNVVHQNLLLKLITVSVKEIEKCKFA